MIPPHIYQLVCQMITKRKQQLANPHLSMLSNNHMCAILTTHGQPIVFGSNEYTPKSKIDGPTRHAEVSAFVKLCKKIKWTKRRMYVDVIVVRTTGGNSRPCTSCHAFMSQMSSRFKIRNVYFTNTSGVDVVRFTQL